MMRNLLNTALCLLIIILIFIGISLRSTSCFAQSTADSRMPSHNHSAKELRTVQNEAFKKGEMLEYRMHYGFIEAGTAKIEVRDEDKKVAGRNVYHVIGTGKSNPRCDFFFKVRDKYESYIDEDGIFPWMFVRRVNEGGYIIKQDYTFFQNKDTVDNGEGKRFAIKHGVQDMISSFYYMRTMDFSNAKNGDIYSVDAFIDDSVWTGKLKYIGTDTVETQLGKFSCLKFAPIVQKGRIFKKEEDLLVYISNDKNRIPILAEAKILVGSLQMELKSYSGLANPVAKVD